MKFLLGIFYAICLIAIFAALCLIFNININIDKGWFKLKVNTEKERK